ncbi:enoyl-CoA hydratase/isomerase family protein [Pseudonocardia acidicola]|uniref:Enoyl-CoA hydratase/isomerase family protein n=1 Tax=Pseudonocardia acidicola TaxID=2724939 RepID=A0ABX1SCJ1_9PSEU|nr:enoyl-CoA hydratase/isomerase family protein [Pseudonocardia acidicola]NMH98223.1 enoyl-CoA hydratase/isomerase family protein [Pseudonocardia acidicola]
MTRYTTVELSKDGPVGELRLCRPDLQNRFDHDLFAEIVPALDELRSDQEVRAVVLSSTGRTFSAGGDMQSMLDANSDLQVLLHQVDEGRQAFRAFADFPKPLVVALHGHTFGVSTSIAFTGDAVVSTPGVRISDPHVHLGLVAGDGGVVTWPTNLPLIRAKRHLLWGEPLLAEDAHALGLVTELVDSADTVRATALELAGRVAALPPVAVQLTKRALNKVLGARVDEAFDTAFYLEAISASTGDLREAVAAFKEKRPGVWSGR